MALITCPECKKEISDQARRCVHCGATNHQGPPSGIAKFFGWTFIALVIGFALIMFIGATAGPDTKRRVQQRDAIAYCDEQAEEVKRDPRMSIGAYQIAYGACEKLRDDFRREWGMEP